MRRFDKHWRGRNLRHEKSETQNCSGAVAAEIELLSEAPASQASAVAQPNRTVDRPSV